MPNNPSLIATGTRATNESIHMASVQQGSALYCPLLPLSLGG
jgi:hypothetical protein